ncbi:hypothetical protein, partial [Paenibacillus sp. Soil522]|uniref:hypothetical protein n=1 Tax=Paenibacillus sp. Soil522 TaxID=1736388 RepID=UPI001F160C63
GLSYPLVQQSAERFASVQRGEDPERFASVQRGEDPALSPNRGCKKGRGAIPRPIIKYRKQSNNLQ